MTLEIDSSKHMLNTLHLQLHPLGAEEETLEYMKIKVQESEIINSPKSHQKTHDQRRYSERKNSKRPLSVRLKTSNSSNHEEISPFSPLITAAHQESVHPSIPKNPSRIY